MLLSRLLSLELEEPRGFCCRWYASRSCDLRSNVDLLALIYIFLAFFFPAEVTVDQPQLKVASAWGHISAVQPTLPRQGISICSFLKSVGYWDVVNASPPLDPCHSQLLLLLVLNPFLLVLNPTAVPVTPFNLINHCTLAPHFCLLRCPPVR